MFNTAQQWLRTRSLLSSIAGDQSGPASLAQQRNLSDSAASSVPARLAPVVAAGIMPAHLVPEWENPARGLYDDQPQQQRDEAVRTATLGAAAIIYTARSLGWGSTPMIGFDAEAVHREFGLAADEIPVMLLSVGPERAGNWPQKPRLPVADVLEFA